MKRTLLIDLMKLLPFFLPHNSGNVFIEIEIEAFIRDEKQPNALKACHFKNKNV
jgi:hypothetical protein